jgi:hypothetical protein
VIFILLKRNSDGVRTKVLGLAVPLTLRAAADEVIE